MTKPKRPATYSTRDIIRIALEANCDPRTVRRVLNGETSSGVSRLAVIRAARKLRIKVHGMEPIRMAIE